MFKNHGPRIPSDRISKLFFKIAHYLGLFDYADSFLNHKIDKWIQLFTEISKIKKQLYLSITGGEPLIYYKQINTIANELKNLYNKFLIRIDTNGSIIPQFSHDIKNLITYNVSYHPTQVKLDKFCNKLNSLKEQGQILMINRVINSDSELSKVVEELEFFSKMGYYLNVNLDHFDITKFSEKTLNYIKKIKSNVDYILPLFSKTIGNQCSYPTFGFQLLPNGYAWIPPCDMNKTINIIDKPINFLKILKNKPIICPAQCVCFHQYPWALDGYKNFNIMAEYVIRNVGHRNQFFSSPCDYRQQLLLLEAKL
ncbi:MAG: hypothetical protein ACPLKS_04145 [Caldisericum exile]|uniref:hypothetical protein n=1 Tax=Caldisericum exile TaxID=693075 RepID=UPI003C7383B2